MDRESSRLKMRPRSELSYLAVREISSQMWIMIAA